jgi:Na+/H+-translocating membrane pyrophosphatase
LLFGRRASEGPTRRDDRHRAVRWKGSDARAAGITGDTVASPTRTTAGPAINQMIKIANIGAILLIPIIASVHG